MVGSSNKSLPENGAIAWSHQPSTVKERAIHPRPLSDDDFQFSFFQVVGSVGSISLQYQYQNYTYIIVEYIIMILYYNV